MPDPERQTISATQTPGLFHVSPYVTRWMLYQHFAKGVSLDKNADSRMDWGKRLQPLVIEQAAQDLRLEVQPNVDEFYVRRGRLGATRDSIILCPDRGPGALETKCVFDYGVWMREWNGGKNPPRHYEIQLQQQMLVGDGVTSFRWGVLAAWVAGEMHYFERTPLPHLWAEIEKEAARLFDDVAGGREPNAFGDPIELPLMQDLFAVASGRTLDLSQDPAAQSWVQVVAEFQSNSTAKNFHEKEYKRLRAKLLALMDGADVLLLPGRVSVKAVRSKRSGYSVEPTTAVTLKTFVPDGDLKMAG